MVKEINQTTLAEIFSADFINENEVFTVALDCIYDAGINPREVDIKYAEQIPLSAPPIVLGIVENDEELSGKLVIVDGNHRMYSFLNVHGVDKIFANVKKYKSRGAAIIDAYRYNLNHGRRLSDKEIAKGIRKTILFLKSEDMDNTYRELARMLNISITSFYEYLRWDKIEKVIGEETDKIKANKLFFMLKEIDGENLIRKFWELNKNLPVRKFVDALRLYKAEGKVVDYEHYVVKKALEKEDEDDGLGEEEIIKPRSAFEEPEETDTEEDYDEEEVDDIESEETVEPVKEKSENTEEEDYHYQYTQNNQKIDEGRTVEIPKMKVEEKNEKLVQMPGMVRPLAFDTVMNNIIGELRDNVITSSSILEETLQKSLHNNRDIFEKHEEEYLKSFDNIISIIMKMRKSIERANKDKR